jgi:hypothetical protein
MRSLFSSVARSALIGAAIGIPLLGIAGRILMRVIAHWEGRVPVLTAGGTFTVIFAGTMFGLAGGAVHGLLKHFIRHAVARNTVFVIIAILLTWRAVNVLLPRPRLMFVALTLVYAIVLELVMNRERAPQTIVQPLNPT